MASAPQYSWPSVEPPSATHKRLAQELEKERQKRAALEQVCMDMDRLSTLGTLVAGVAHEIRSPLAYIQANFDWLKIELERMVALVDAMASALFDSERESTAAQEALKSWQGMAAEDFANELRDVRQECSVGVQRMTDILDSLRLYSQSRHIRSRPFDVSKCVDEAIRLVTCKYKHGVQIEVTILETLPTLFGRESELCQILVNLLVNACEAMNSEGKISVCVAPEESGVVVEVEDSGTGIPSHLRNKIFEPFFTLKADEGGTGLGLAISRNLARKHGGDLQCGASVLGGARFVLLFRNILLHEEGS